MMTSLIRPVGLNHRLIAQLAPVSGRSISTSLANCKHQETKAWQRKLAYKDEGVQGISLVGVGTNYEDRFLKHVDFPSVGLEERDFNGMKFADIPILEMTTHKNNTRLACFDQNYSKMIQYTSAGTEGFKNCKKGTTVAAHAAGYAMGKKLQLKGHRQVRLAIKGIGAGRKAAVQGMNASGLTIISITDITNYNPYPRLRAPRPLKR